MRALYILVLIMIVFLSSLPSSEATTWWNTSWEKRRQITIVNNANEPLPSGYTVNITLNTTDPDFNPDGSDVRIVFDNGVNLTEIDRINITPFGISNTAIEFATQEDISPFSNSTKYWVYYNNSFSSSPPIDWTKVYRMNADGSFPSKGNWINGAAYPDEYNVGDGRLKINALIRGQGRYLYVNYNSTNNKEFRIRAEVNSSIFTYPQSDFFFGIANETDADFRGNDYAIGVQVHRETGANVFILGIWGGKAGYSESPGDPGKSALGIFYTPNTVYYLQITRNSTCWLRLDVFQNSDFTVPVSDSPRHLNDDTCDYINHTYSLSSRAVVDSQAISGHIDNYRTYIFFDEEPTTILGPQENSHGPILEPIGNKFINENETLIIQLNASDLNNDTLVFGTNAGNILPSSFEFNETTGLFTWTPQSGDTGRYSVLFNVTDGNLTDSETIIIKVGNRPPNLTPIGNKIVGENHVLIINVTATDPDNDPLRFGTNAATVLPSPFSLNENSGLFAWTPTFLDAGIYSILFNVTDGISLDEQIVNITVINQNGPPVFDFIGNKAINENETLTIQLSATDPDNDTLIFGINADSILSNFTSNLTFDPFTGLFQWTPTFFDAGVYSVMFNVTDGLFFDEETIEITVNDVNGPPIFDPIGNKAIREGQILEIQLNASDPDFDTLTFGTNAASILPPTSPSSEPEFFFDNEAGLFVWQPDFDDSGVYSVNFNVSDGIFTDEETITIFVLNTNLAPKLSPVGNRTVNENETITIQLTATDFDNDTLSFGTNATFGILNKTTGLFNWTPTFFDAGFYAILFNVTDGFLSDKIVVNITVINRPGPPVLNPIPDIIVNETDVVIIKPNAVDPDNDTIVYSVNDTKFTKIDSNIFIWDTQAGDAGNYTFLVTASDGNLTNSIEVKVIVKKPYVCGDATGDKKVNLADIIYLVNYVFKGGPKPVPLEAGDVNRDGNVNLADIIYLVNYVFKGGPVPCSIA